MPYKVVGSSVMVQRGGKWVTLHRHETKQKAHAQVAAIRANTKGKEHR